MSHVVNALLLDDNETEAASMAKLLKRQDMTVQLLKPDQSVVQTTTALIEALGGSVGPAVVLMDYRLDDREDVDFRGGSVAGMFKERRPEIPVILFTTDQKLHDWVETRPGISDLFDWRLLKGDVADGARRSDAQARVVDVATAWAAFGALNDADPWDALAAAMNVPVGQLAVFSRVEPDPPTPEVAGSLARWLLHGPISWDGPLLRRGDVRVALGLTQDDFHVAKDWLMACEYDGLFSHFEQRWWATTIVDQLRAALGRIGLDAGERAALFGRQPEGCVWCGGLRTIKACATCGLAVDAAHSIRCLTGRPPAWADAEVVCFQCVQDGTAGDVRFAPGSEDVVEGLIKGSIAAPQR